MNIVQAKPLDIVEAVFLLEKAIQHFINENLQHWISFLPNRQILADNIDKKELFLAKDHGVSKGFMVLKKEMPEDYAEVSWKSPDKSLSVYYLVAHPDWADTNIFNEMLQYAEKHARENGFTSIKVDAFSDNQDKMKALGAEGFDNVGEFQKALQRVPHFGYEKDF